ncbi:MAG: helix-turn-helix domain-containing protein [Thermoleophilia bacterium]
MRGTDRKIVGYRIRIARQEAKLTQSELGRLVGKSHAAISDVERGKTNLSIDELRKIARSLGREIADFVTEDQNAEPTISAKFLRGGREDSGEANPAVDKVVRDFRDFIRKRADEGKQ